MSEARIPTTLPIPVNRGQFGFDAAGVVWLWIDDICPTTSDEAEAVCA